MDVYRDERRSAAEALMAAQGTAMAAYAILLAAHAEGLGGCWMCAPLFCGDTVVDITGLPEHWQPQALLALGWPSGEPRVRDRRPIDQLVSFI